MLANPLQDCADELSLLHLPTLSDLLAQAPLQAQAVDALLLRAGAPCLSLPVLIQGRARVCLRDSAGQPVILYRLHPHALCPLSLAALLQGVPCSAEVIAETPLQLHYLPGGPLQQRIHQDPDLYGQILDAFTIFLRLSAHMVHPQPAAPRDERLSCEPDSRGHSTPAELDDSQQEQRRRE